jgi:hypothetical protein
MIDSTEATEGFGPVRLAAAVVRDASRREESQVVTNSALP